MTPYSPEMAEYRGETYFAGAEGPDHVWIRKVPGVAYANAEGFQTYGNREFATVAVEELQAWYFERCTATWRGQRFAVVMIHDGKAEAGYAGGDYVWAAQNGLEGDQYNGFRATLNVDELENVQIERTDLLARWREKNPG
ncbi:hypothetical protein [Allokutzneria oryzae]|uniref:Uncharacterized protein n=1 Tax=Allokutzneria oryzae TaxID=1378989 RepID=A0ABV5ZXK4_9PSEU